MTVLFSIWGIDSKLRGCDMVKIKIGDLVAGKEIRTPCDCRPAEDRSPGTVRVDRRREGHLLAWLERRGGTAYDHAFPSRINHAHHMSTRQYARLVG